MPKLTLISNGLLEVTPLIQVQKCKKKADLKINLLKHCYIYTTSAKGAYHIAHGLRSEEFNPSPVADTVRNLMFPN